MQPQPPDAVRDVGREGVRRGEPALESGDRRVAAARELVDDVARGAILVADQQLDQLGVAELGEVVARIGWE